TSALRCGFGSESNSKLFVKDMALRTSQSGTVGFGQQLIAELAGASLTAPNKFNDPHGDNALGPGVVVNVQRPADVIESGRHHLRPGSAAGGMPYIISPAIIAMPNHK